MSIEVKDPRMTRLVRADAAVETIADTFRFTEGPAWHPRERHLTFSDIPANRLYRYREGGDIAVYREPSHMTNGNTYDRAGRLLSCEHATSRVVREEGGRLDVLASHYEGRELNSPNDIVVARDGTLLFTDPTYGRRAAPTGLERPLVLDFRGLYRLDPATRALSLLARDFEQPNGLCLGLDERTLYVADTTRRHIRRFRFGAGGSLDDGPVFAESPAPDGLKIDSEGNVYAGGPGGVHVYDRADGTHLGVIGTGAFCANFAWGGDDLRTLYLTSSTKLLRVRVEVPGLPLF
jgi:gluconolactonase